MHELMCFITVISMVICSHCVIVGLFEFSDNKWELMRKIAYATLRMEIGSFNLCITHFPYI